MISRVRFLFFVLTDFFEAFNKGKNGVHFGFFILSSGEKSYPNMRFPILISKTHFISFTDVGFVISYLRSCSEGKVIVEKFFDFFNRLVKGKTKFFIGKRNIDGFFGVVIVGEVELVDGV